jgi:hypothetical protein
MARAGRTRCDDGDAAVIGTRRPFDRASPPRAQAGAFRPVGVAIVVAGALLLYFALQSVRGGTHPLSTVVGADLCARLGPQPPVDLPGLRAPQAQIPDLAAGRSSTCYWPVGDTDPPTGGIGLVLMTHQSLRAEGNGGGTRAYVDTFLEESRASGAEVVAVAGPWKTAATIRNPGAGGPQLLAEDDGVALWATAREVEREPLVDFVAAAARRLRESKR